MTISKNGHVRCNRVCRRGSGRPIRKLRDLSLDGSNPGEKLCSIRPLHSGTGIDQRDLGFVVSDWKAAGLAGECPIRSDMNTRLDDRHATSPWYDGFEPPSLL
jgi:hypothetical protein